MPASAMITVTDVTRDGLVCVEEAEILLAESAVRIGLVRLL